MGRLKGAELEGGEAERGRVRGWKGWKGAELEGGEAERERS